MRELILSKTIDLLKQKGFIVSSFIHSNSCFDLIAKNSLTLVVKVFNNIDSLREEQADELRKFSQLFKAEPLIIGEKTKVFSLKKGTVYDRYGLPVLSFDSFKDLLNERIPFIKYFKGKNIVELDSVLLKEKRESIGLSLSDLADKMDLARETLHRYEQGVSSSLETARQLEKFFHCSLIKKPQAFEFREEQEKDLFSEEFEDKTLEKVRDLGLKLSVFQHAPFKAYSQPKESLLISTGKKKLEIRKKALDLGKAQTVIPSEPLIISKEFKEKMIERIPIIEEEELSTLSKAQDLLKLIRERKKKS